MNSASAPAYYKIPDATVRPGDVVRFAPFVQAIRKPLVHVKSNKSTKGTPPNARLLADLLGDARGETIPANILNGSKETEFVVRGRFDFALLLTRGCDVENGAHRQLAAIRPLSTVQGEANQVEVIDGRATSLHYLPAHDTVLTADSFIDFRYIVTLHKELFDDLERPLALTREGLLDVYFSWMRHTIGKKVPATTKCETCGAEIPVFQDIAEVANPPADY